MIGTVDSSGELSSLLRDNLEDIREDPAKLNMSELILLKLDDFDKFNGFSTSSGCIISYGPIILDGLGVLKQGGSDGL